MRRILVTGADGFVGRSLVAFLHRGGNSVLAAGRKVQAVTAPEIEQFPIADIRSTKWETVLSGVDAVVHLAARAHVLLEDSVDPLAEFRATNVQPTASLFRACQAASVGRFVFVSSIGVNGTYTTGTPFTEVDRPNPTEPYAISKWEAEELLRAQFREGSTGLTIVRPALVYGPNAKGNFQRLMQLVRVGLPLPFAEARGRRSFMALTAFCDLLGRCLISPNTGMQMFVAADNRSVTTSEVIDALATAMGLPRKQWRVPLGLLSVVAKAIGRTAEFERLTGSLEVDPALAKSALGWSSEALGPDLHAMAETYLRTRNAA